MGITHAFTNPKSDGADTTVVRPSDWNAEHVVSGISSLYLDTLPVGATYGDEFDEASLNARWTPTGVFKATNGQYAVSGTWLVLKFPTTSTGSIFQAAPATDTLEVIAAFSTHAIGNMIGPAIVSSTGTGVYAAIRTDNARFVIANTTAYAHTGDGVARVITTGDSVLGGGKVWISLRKFATALDGDIYFARYSQDGCTWSWTVKYNPSDFTVAKIGFGRMGSNNGVSNDRTAIDRFVVVGLDVGNNLVRTPTSGTPTYTASSAGGGAAANAADGTSSSWAASTGATDNPLYWQVAWSVGQTLNRVIIKDRNSGGGIFGLAHLELNDGATTTYVALDDLLNNTEAWYLAEFPTLTGITSLRVVSDSAAANSCGLIEVEAYLAS
jgi:hypothetical protein